MKYSRMKCSNAKCQMARLQVVLRLRFVIELHNAANSLTLKFKLISKRVIDKLTALQQQNDEEEEKE